MNNFTDCPELSIVATTRNDNHGGDLKYRMQLFIDNILEQTKKYKFNVELILVEWNPPKDKKRLNEELCWNKKNDYCNIRIIEVPEQMHNKYNFSQSLPLYQMIGKNVGIRRAKGKYILATNVDIIFSDELFEFLISGKLQENKIYRVDRYDVRNEIPISGTHEDKINYCKKNIIRINERFYTESYINNEKYLVYPKEIEELANNKKIKEPPHCNACGDFQLMARKHWFELNGYPELDMYSMHIDSLMQYMSRANGIEEIYLNNPMVTYHMEHTSGFQPENKELESQLNKRKVDSLTYLQLITFANNMALNKKPIIFNDENWGLNNVELTNINKNCNTDFEPNNVCNTEEWLYFVEAEYNKLLTLGTSTFEEFFEKLLIIRRRYVNDELLEDDYIRYFLQHLNKKKIIVFGASNGYKNFFSKILNLFNKNPLYIIDNDKNKHGAFINGIQVLPVETLLDEKKEDTLIIVCSQFYEEIKEQLNSLGFSEDTHYFDYLSSMYIYISVGYILAENDMKI
ncbi:hypothetical protein [Clostridium sp. OS1-26]|uniref:hypothetical protein n=1 Tax=Clostridium sp. OS1-26 TaxID=3070681 RepID=UPI0027E1727A|nr:hypothetical protein [Clostridium sp. OS1-26]WML35471.1 hypothetical protein RCG18_01565 [Clostridium sp. OS1-26]